MFPYFRVAVLAAMVNQNMSKPSNSQNAPKRRELLATFGALAAWPFVVAPALAGGRVILPKPDSLADELALALAIRKPLIVMVSLEGCQFCHIARDSHLGPLRVEEQQPVVQVDMRSARLVRDFRGQQVTHDQLTRAWGIRVTPTVLFFGKRGVEVADRLVGGYIPDFYGAYLEERLRTARRSLV